MENLKKLIEEQNELNIYIDKKVEALRNHQNNLNIIIVEKMIENGLNHAIGESNPNKHIFTYSELRIVIEIKNPVDEKVPLSEAATRRLIIEVLIERKFNTPANKYVIYDRTKYKTEYQEKGICRYSTDKNESSEIDLFIILEKIFKYELSLSINDNDLPF